jgi:hypothetical protein
LSAHEKFDLSSGIRGGGAKIDYACIALPSPDPCSAVQTGNLGKTPSDGLSDLRSDHSTRLLLRWKRKRQTQAEESDKSIPSYQTTKRELVVAIWLGEAFSAR